jgi:lipopolysaccharide/colanic/teichoic acid biosynthesis glycosyltransferase
LFGNGGSGHHELGHEFTGAGMSTAGLGQLAPATSGAPLPVFPPDAVADHPPGHSLRLSQRVFKRVLDITIALPLFLVTLPLVVLSAIAIKLDSPGPAFYHHVRVGQEGRRFWCRKLRTMTGSDDDEANREFLAAIVRCQATPHHGIFKFTTGHRITRVGRILRRMSIDELPQLWNVLTGTMSIVGPRPPVLAEAEAYREHDWERLRMKPGLTGLAQVRGRSGLRFDQIVAADIEYARTWSPFLELKIIALTPMTVLSGRGAG